MNIYDIAEKAGVSIATVSRVLNQKGGVSPQTRERVLGVISHEGYTPNIFARGLGLNTWRSVGIACTDLSDIYYACAVSYIENELRDRGFDSILCCTGYGLEGKKKGVDLLLSKRVDALVLIGSVFKERADNSHVEKAAKRLPVVVLNADFGIDNTFCVCYDDRDAVRRIVAELARQRRREILYLYDAESFSGILKLDGFKAGLFEAGIAYSPEMTVMTGRTNRDAFAEVSRRLEGGARFDAVVCAQDALAAGALQALLTRGIDVPREVAVVGFNNSVLSQCTIPEITSVDTRLDTMCATAVRYLADALEGRDVPAKTVVSSELVVRGTFVPME